MKAFLMYPQRDFDVKQTLPPNAEALVQDLELNTLFAAMAHGDKFLLEVARVAVLSGAEADARTILYRQGVLQDCLNNAALITADLRPGCGHHRSREARVVGRVRENARDNTAPVDRSA